MTPAQKKEFEKEEAEEHHHHENRGLLFREGPAHDCEFDPNMKSPLASCRRKYPPKPNHEGYDLDRPNT